MNQKGNLTLVLLFMLVIIAGLSFYYFKMYFKRLQADYEFSANQILGREPQPVKTSYMMYSPEKTFSLLINYEDDGRGKFSCEKTLYDGFGNEKHFEDINRFLKNVGCRLGPSSAITLDGFKNFSDDNMVFNLLGKNIDILDLTKGAVETLSYEINEGQRDYNFFAADTNLKYLLFSQDGYGFIDQVKDYSGKEVVNIQPLLGLENNDSITSYYDDANHGILYLKEKTSGQKGYQFSYFDLKTKKMKHLRFIDRNLEAGGRGCGGNFLIPEEKKLTFMGGCMDVLPKDKNEAGEIILNL